MSLWSNIVGLFSALGKLFQSPSQIPAPPAPPSDPNWVAPTKPDPGATITELLREHNDFRNNNGVSPLVGNDALHFAAQRHATWMAINRIMSHTESPDTQGYEAQDFSQRIKNEGYVPYTGGENIAAGQRSVPEVMDAWMDSPGHRANILNGAYWNVGFGSAQDQYGHIYWCAVFASPLTKTTLSRLKIARVQVLVSLPRAVVC